MQLKKLSLTNFRAFQQADFDFQPGMNLIVGINGVGKSTSLDALRIMLSQILPKFATSKSQSLSFKESDITVGGNGLFLDLVFEANGIDFSYEVSMPREKYSSETRREIPDEEFSHQLSREDRIRLRREKLTGYTLIERYELQPDDTNLFKLLKTNKEQPLAVFFSTRRSVAIGDAPSKSASAGGQAAAFSESLSDRELRLRELAEWWRVQETLGEETGEPVFGKHMDILSNTVSNFLGNIQNIRAVNEPKITLLLEKENTTLDINQLSDGERGMVSLVLDLARRLAQANPGLSDPLRDGQAVVLIDELDLHLHPRWQREVVKKLTSTFPACQFIATTHSPQIVGEVSPDNIIILDVGKIPYRPDQSLGMDTNWILRNLMDTDEQSLEAKFVLRQISDLIENEDYDKASEMIGAAQIIFHGETAALVDLQAQIDQIKFLGEK